MPLPTQDLQATQAWDSPSSSSEEEYCSPDESFNSQPTTTQHRDAVPPTALPLTSEALQGIRLIKIIQDFNPRMHFAAVVTYLDDHSLANDESIYDFWYDACLFKIPDFLTLVDTYSYYRDLLTKALTMDLMTLYLRCRPFRSSHWIYTKIHQLSGLTCPCELEDFHRSTLALFQKKTNEYHSLFDDLFTIDWAFNMPCHQHRL